MGGLVSHTQRKEAISEEVTVYIYESEYRQIQAWVDKHQNLETGGDLFGLWADDHTAVVQLVLGPGEHCTRTSTSFYQDVEYLKRVGNLLTYQEGLCHIGEWHSHHRLGLKEPSGGDKNTVWRNMDRYGIHRFCLFIATIQSSGSHEGSIQDYVSVNGFIFKTTVDKHRFLKLSPCKFISPPEKSPFRLKYNDDINEGVESVNEERDLQKADVADKREKHADQPQKEGERREYRGAENKKRNPELQADSSCSHGGPTQEDVAVNNRYRKVLREGTFRKHVQEESPLRVKYTKDIDEGAESVNDEVHLQAYVPVQNTTKTRGKAEYEPMMLVEDQKPEDSCCRFCPMCLFVNWISGIYMVKRNARAI